MSFRPSEKATTLTKLLALLGMASETDNWKEICPAARFSKELKAIFPAQEQSDFLGSSYLLWPVRDITHPARSALQICHFWFCWLQADSLEVRAPVLKAALKKSNTNCPSKDLRGKGQTKHPWSGKKMQVKRVWWSKQPPAGAGCDWSMHVTGGCWWHSWWRTPGMGFWHALKCVWKVLNTHMLPLRPNQSQRDTPRLQHFGEIRPQNARTDPRGEPSTTDCFVQQDTDITYIVVISVWKSSCDTHPAPLVPINPGFLESEAPNLSSSFKTTNTNKNAFPTSDTTVSLGWLTGFMCNSS